MTVEIPLTVTDTAARLRHGTLTSRDLTEAVIERADRIDPKIGCYVTRLDDYALKRADLADRELAEGIDRGTFHGIPIGVKDIVAVAEGPTTANSLVLDRAWGAHRDAPVVTRLKDAGAVIMGKVTTSEFAIGFPDPTKPFAIPRNPWDLDRTPGGSSAGTGNGIAAGLFLAGIGTDTGGSIRIPAAWNGTTGLMPTFGRVPKSGCVPLGYSLDHIGPLARTARDCAEMLTVIAGYDPSDECCAERAVDDYLGPLTGDLKGLRIGADRSPRFFPEQSDAVLRDRFEAAMEVLARLGAEIVEVELPYYEEVSAALWTMMSSEALAYHREDLGSRWVDYSAMGRMNIARGTFFSGTDYVQAARLRRLVQRKLGELLAGVDVVATPTSAVTAPPGERMSMPRTDAFFSIVFTGYWDVVGNPALVLPLGPGADGLPLSLQLGGRPFDEATLLRTGDAYQKATDWHLQVPPIAGEVAGSPTRETKTSMTDATTEPDPKVAATVATLLAAAGLAPSPAEVAILVGQYPSFRAAVERLHSMPELRYESPGLIFTATPVFADWAARA
jgi:aspartyl-tRNA(Asn)/glutamyl-tRNA(Gln) amidotransferase subunit A